MAACLHCRRRPGGYARGLCAVCFKLPGARERYPLLAATGRRLSGAKPCRHCEEKPAARWKRGLCYGCYQRLSIRVQYPKGGEQFAPRGRADFCGRAAVGAAAPGALPGSKKKVEVLMERAQLGQSLFNPGDGRYRDSPLPAGDVSLPAELRSRGEGE